MAHITEEHLHHMARRHHATMQKLDGLRDRFAGITTRFIGTIEVGAASWLGGALEGRTQGAALGPVPYNLGIGALLLVAGHLNLANRPGGPDVSDHLNNLGNGFVGSYLAATGYAWGKKWKDTGKLFGNHSWSQAYENQPGGGASMGPPPPGHP